MIIVFKKHSLVFARKYSNCKVKNTVLLLQEIFKLQIKCKLQSFKIVICTVQLQNYVPLAAQSKYKLPMPSVVYLPTPSLAATSSSFFFSSGSISESPQPVIIPARSTSALTLLSIVLCTRWVLDREIFTLPFIWH